MKILVSLLILWQFCFLNLVLSSNTMSFIQPQNKQRIPAGTGTTVRFSYIPPPGPLTANVTLTCSPTMIYSAIVTRTSTTPFDVPPSFYGDKCNFTATATDYILTDPVMVTITQPLTFTSPTNNAIFTINTPNTPIPVKMSTGNVNTSSTVGLQFSCTSYTSPILPFSIITSSLTAYNYNSYPTEAYGPCSFTVVSAPSYLVLPTKLNVYLKYSITITAPSIMYNGQYFNTTVSCAQTPGVSSVILNLVYSSTIVQSYTVDINQQATLVAPDTLTLGPGYTLEVATNENFNGAQSDTFSVEDVQLRFSQPPVGSTYSPPFNIPILIDSANVTSILPANQPISVTLTCDTNIVDTFSVIIGIQTNYNNPNDGTGNCTFIAPSSVSYLISPLPVTIILAQPSQRSTGYSLFKAFFKSGFSPSSRVSNGSSKRVCAKKLAKIEEQPCLAVVNYMKKLEAEVKANYINWLTISTRTETVVAFCNTYGIMVNLINPMGYGIMFPNPVFPVPFFDVSYMRSLALNKGVYQAATGPYVYYTFPLRSTDAALLMVQFMVPKLHLPISNIKYNK